MNEEVKRYTARPHGCVPRRTEYSRGEPDLGRRRVCQRRPNVDPLAHPSIGGQYSGVGDSVPGFSVGQPVPSLVRSARCALNVRQRAQLPTPGNCRARQRTALTAGIWIAHQTVELFPDRPLLEIPTGGVAHEERSPGPARRRPSLPPRRLASGGRLVPRRHHLPRCRQPARAMWSATATMALLGPQ